MKPRILLIEDDIGTRFGYAKYLSNIGYEIIETANIAEAEKALVSEKIDCIIVDIMLPDGSGLDFMDSVKAYSPLIPIIVITGFGDITVAVDAMRRGADNFFIKPVSMEGLEIFLTKILEIKSLRKDRLNLERHAGKMDIFIGNTPAMKKVLELAEIAADSDSQVLITGETGTGKGMIANWIHNKSKRSRNSFVEINCSGLSRELLAREIFGNVRGAFTSADQDRPGLLDIADQGTLFLDEIGDMSLEVQAQFLKVLEEKSFRRLGDVKLRRSDFRLISATNKDIEYEAFNGMFRQDLFFRINLLTIHLPSLRERIDELPEIISHVLRSIGVQRKEITDESMQLLSAYQWPGNWRELKNILERAILLSKGKTLTTEYFSGLITPLPACNTGNSKGPHEIEKADILSELKRFNGKVNETAKSLGISRATLYRRLKRFGILT